MATQAIPREDVSPVRGSSLKQQKTLVDAITYFLLALGAAVVLVPFWWMVKTSLTAETRLGLEGLLPDINLQKRARLPRRCDEQRLGKKL